MAFWLITLDYLSGCNVVTMVLIRKRRSRGEGGVEDREKSWRDMKMPGCWLGNTGSL